ncbi:hypothetical protein SRHO_G00343170 [Serrasalmus rhombeus]
MAHTFQSVTVTTSWCLSAVNSCLLVFYVLEALLKILIQGRTYFRNPWNDLDFFILLMTLLDFVLSLVQSGGGFSSRQASTLFRVFKTLKGARVFRALRLLKAIRFFKGLQDILLTCLQSFRSMSSILVLMFLFLFIFAVVFREMFNESDPEHFGSIFRTVFTLFQILTLDDWSLIYMTSRDNGAPHIIYFMSLYILVELFTFLNLFIAVLVDNFQLSIRKKRHHKSQKSPDVKEGEAQSTKKAGEDLDVSLAEIEEEFYKEALRHASSDGKHSKRKIELTKRYLQLLAAMDQHAQKYRSQACLLDKLVETFFMVGTGPHCCPRDPNPEEADDDGWMDGWMLKLCSEVEFFRSTLNGATPGTRSLRPGEPGKLRKMCPERDASALSGFIPPWERQRFNTHSFRQQNSELCAGAALRGTTRTAGTCLRLLSNGGGGGAHCDVTAI